MYPKIRVFWYFSLCPAVAGFFLYLWLLFQNLGASDFLSADMVIFALMLPVASLAAMLFYGIPALILAWIYTLFELRKRPHDIFIVSLAGGVAAFSWSHLVPLPMEPLLCFVCGAGSSLLMSFLALPCVVAD
ncbi:hypothetical protein ACFSE1_09840 [Rhizobium helianthi]|uniref:Uncharacterized protein n=1 Tax=Rhizobium helianthi TaxID=1132695 RepID=A0ABW4M2Z0_9HYPH